MFPTRHLFLVPQAQPAKDTWLWGRECRQDNKLRGTGEREPGRIGGGRGTGGGRGEGGKRDTQNGRNREKRRKIS